MAEKRENNVSMDVARTSVGLAGATLLAAGTHAYGAIVAAEVPNDLLDAGADVPVPGPGDFDFIEWDVDGDGTSDFGFNYRNLNGTPDFPWQANAFTLGDNQVIGYGGPFLTYGTNLNAGDPVGPGGAFVGVPAGQVALGSEYFAAPYGGWGSNSRGFLGLQFEINGNTHFGWIEIETANGLGMIFHGAAFEDTPNTAIEAGAVPAPGSLAFLALGAAGVLSGRKRKN